ncbi:hypothetical protein ADK52_20140 [Streptomyces sp. WM6372]|nr:hypothetical protein ADK52_20140 [Streptomyces sp. WM6372]
MSGAGGGQVLADLPGGLRAKRYGAADRAQSARLVVAAEDQELRAVQGSGDGADDRCGGVPSSDLGPSLHQVDMRVDVGGISQQLA